ncbi:MAG: hypothetical protein Q4A54_04830, partial [Parabacteroides sp.]|nr:hypothetical protein [Parabacteroides sp.]
VQGMKKQLTEMLGEVSEMSYGKYIRDENRIVLSAPEIIIGNVDREGVLWNMPSNVVIRANEVNLEGVGVGEVAGGKVTTRAASIRSIAEDPGKDGTEKAVLPVSEIVSQAKSITLNSEDVEGVFTSPAYGFTTGIELRSETGIGLNATLSNQGKKEKLKNAGKKLKEVVKELESQSKTMKKDVDTYMKELKALLNFEDMTESVISTRVNYLEIDELYEDFNRSAISLYKAMNGYFKVLAQLAEANRQVSCLEEMEKQVDKKKASFKEKPTGTYISMRSERIDALSIDGDGNFRENPEAGVSINAKRVGIGTYKADESLHDDSSISLASRNVSISTLNPKVERNDKGEITKGDYPAIGDVHIHSKNIRMETVDYEWKDKKVQEKTLTKAGQIAMRTEAVDVAITDTEGKATGKVEVNAKKVEVKAMDVDKEKRTDKNLATGSSLLLLAEKVYAGTFDKKIRSKQMQIASDCVGVFADTTLELQQDKGVVQLAGGNASVGGGSLDLYGKTTLQGEVTAKGAIKGGDLEVKNMDVKSSFKTPCTTEGMAVPGAPATGKLTAKLKEEELKADNKQA